jgi:hypothetical protein
LVTKAFLVFLVQPPSMNLTQAPLTYVKAKNGSVHNLPKPSVLSAETSSQSSESEDWSDLSCL